MASLFEPYVQLVDVTATAALAAWGGFVLEEHGDAWRARRTGETFGARSVPVGRAAVESARTRPSTDVPPEACGVLLGKPLTPFVVFH